MNTSKMKVATLMVMYGAGKQRVARVIGARRATKLIKHTWRTQ